MKKLITVVLLVAFCVGISNAGVFFPKGFTPGLMSLYDFGATKAWWEGLFIPILGASDYVYLEGGALTTIEKTTPAISVSFNVPKILSLIPGVTVEIKGLVTIGYGIARNLRDKCTMHGLTIRRSF